MDRYGKQINEMKTLCDLGVGGQRGLVYYPFGVAMALSATQYKDAPKILVKELDKIMSISNALTEPNRTEPNRTEPNRTDSIVVLGGLGVSKRRDRDPDRVLDPRGVMYALPAHASIDAPRVLVREKGS